MKKPNIILINCDDLGYGDLGCYGSQLNSTPVLDRLAAEGMRFTDFYQASSICTPSRAGMLTGCYPQRISMQRVLFPADKDGLHNDEETIASMLKGAGYQTALIGKWHLGDQPEFLPLKHGFDHYYGIPYSNDMGRQASRKPRPSGTKGPPPLPLLLGSDVIEQQPDQAGLTERYVEQCVGFMRASVDSGKPFFLYLAHMHVHLPIYVAALFMKESKNGRYGGAVACIDWAWACIDAELKRLGITDDTLVLFTSDNGSRAGGEGGSNAPFRGTKFSTWEGGFRLPLIARWPGRIPAGRVCGAIAASIDLFPTIAGWTGSSASGKHKTDGVNIGVLFEKEGSVSPRGVFCYYKFGNLAAVRKGAWKLHFCVTAAGSKPFAGYNALYNLESDSAEQNDISTQHPGVVAELSAIADEIRKDLGDKFTGVTGAGVRPCGVVENPKPLTCYDDACPCIVAEYDLTDQG